MCPHKSENDPKNGSKKMTKILQYCTKEEKNVGKVLAKITKLLQEKLFIKKNPYIILTKISNDIATKM